jgi:hypothetical protein
MRLDEDSSSNSGGWAAYALNGYLNNRVYNAFANQWKQLIKQVKVKSSIGDKSMTVANSDCYVFIPAISELYDGASQEPYASEGTLISHFSSNPARICYTPDGMAAQYWTRSPNVGYTNYAYRISNDGNPQSITPLSENNIYVRMMLSM